MGKDCSDSGDRLEAFDEVFRQGPQKGGWCQWLESDARDLLQANMSSDVVAAKCNHLISHTDRCVTM